MEPMDDYYEILQCDRKASQEELKKSYQRLALIFHPDKKITGNNIDNFVNIQKAWSVLRNPQSRKQYDAILSCKEHGELLLYDTVTVSELNFDSCNKVYSYQCRCGGVYSVNASEIIAPKTIVECDECSLSIQVDVPS